jgi:hypothetical protein
MEADWGKLPEWRAKHHHCRGSTAIKGSKCLHTICTLQAEGKEITVSMFIDLEQTFEQNRNHIMKETHRSELCIKAQKERKKKKPRVNGITTASGIMRKHLAPTKHEGAED